MAEEAEGALQAAARFASKAMVMVELGRASSGTTPPSC